MTWFKFLKFCLLDVHFEYCSGYRAYHIKRVWREWQDEKFLTEHKAKTARLRRLFDEEQHRLRQAQVADIFAAEARGEFKHLRFPEETK